MFDLLQILQNGVPDLPVAVLFFLFFFGTFVSEDAACLLAGTAVASGRMSFALALAACFLGIFVGDVLLYAVGRAFGKRVFDSSLVKRFVSDRTISHASGWLGKNAAAAVFLSRFASGLRLPTYLLAGALKTDIVKFSFYFLIASAVWTPILVGSTAFSQAFLFPQNALFGLIVTGIVIRIIFKYRSWKNRRLLVGRLPVRRGGDHQAAGGHDTHNRPHNLPVHTASLTEPDRREAADCSDCGARGPTLRAAPSF